MCLKAVENGEVDENRLALSAPVAKRLGAQFEKLSGLSLVFNKALTEARAPDVQGFIAPKTIEKAATFVELISKATEDAESWLAKLEAPKGATTEWFTNTKTLCQDLKSMTDKLNKSVDEAKEG